MRFLTKHKFFLAVMYLLLLPAFSTAQILDCDEGDEEGEYGGGEPMGEPDSIDIPIVHSVDPNEVLGSIGYDTPRWVSINDELGYTIFFENDPDFATAPAQIVDIRLPLDPELSLFSLRLGEFGFGAFTFSVPPNSTFYTQRLDVVDSLNVYVDITAGIDVVEKEAFWIFESIDPLTGLPPEDALTGFLPVGDTSVTIYNDTLPKANEGFVTFTIHPDPSDVTGDSISAQASIVFDDNAPLITNTWENLVDAVAPTSYLDTLPSTVAMTTTTLTWTGTDDVGGVGVDFYDLYVSKNSGPFFLHAGEIDTTEYAFTGSAGSTYAFYILATDHVGNREQKMIAETAVTLLDSIPSNACDSVNISILSGTLIPMGTYRANNNLTAAGTVQSFQNVTFTAGVEIDLLAGFQVDLGADFYAIIAECVLLNSRPSGLKLAASTAEQLLQATDKLTLKVEYHESAELADFYIYLPEDDEISLEIQHPTQPTNTLVLPPQQVEKGYYLVPFDAQQLSKGVHVILLKSKQGQIRQIFHRNGF